MWMCAHPIMMSLRCQKSDPYNCLVKKSVRITNLLQHLILNSPLFTSICIYPSQFSALQSTFGTTPSDRHATPTVGTPNQPEVLQLSSPLSHNIKEQVGITPAGTHHRYRPSIHKNLQLPNPDSDFLRIHERGKNNFE